MGRALREEPEGRLGGEDREGRAGAGLAEPSGEGLQLVGRGQEGGATAV